MNEKNFDYLSKQVKFTGFGEGHAAQLKEKMLEGKPEFMLTHQQDFGKDSTVATLQFRKSDTQDKYFFNSYNLLLKTQQQTDPIRQTFYISNDARRKEQDDITLKEGYNLLSGRAVNKDLVNKEGVAYNAWVQLDFKTTDKHGNFEEKKFHKNYGFDLQAVLAAHPLKELATEKDKTMLLESLQRGNRQGVTFMAEGREQKVFIEAAPQYKGLNFYDSSMKRMNAQSLYEKQGEGKSSEQASKKEAVKNDVTAGDDEGGGARKRNNKRQGVKIS